MIYADKCFGETHLGFVTLKEKAGYGNKKF